MIDLALSPEDEQKRNQTMQMQQAPLAQVQSPQPQQKGMAGQMGDMVKQKLMSDAAGAGAKAITAGAKQGMSSMLAPTVGSAIEGGSVLGPMAGGGGMAAIGTAMPYVGAGLLAGKALGLFNEGGQVGPLSPQYHAEGMSAEDYKYQMPGGDVYNARMEKNKVKQAKRPIMPVMRNEDGSINQQYYDMQEGMRQLQKQQDFVYPQVISDNGKKMGVLRMAYTDDPMAQRMYGVGNAPIDTSIMPMGFIGHPTNDQGYTARGYDQGGSVGMTEADARALMMNQPNPDQLYNEIVAENMTEAAIGTPMAMPMMRPPLAAEPLNADTTSSPYDMLRPDNAPNT